MRKQRKWREYLIERLTTNQEEAIGFLDAIMEEFLIYENITTLQNALKVVIEAHGGMTELAKRTHMSPDALQKILSSDKAPHVDTLGTILNALGCRLSVVPLGKEESNLESAPEDQSISAAG